MVQRLSYPLLLIGFLLFAFACATVHRPPTTDQAIRESAGALNQQRRATIDKMIDTLAERTYQRHDDSINLLMLSAGGEDGAYGAGFLKGWFSRSEGEKPPIFDVVTGVSTGALQAPFALLGNAEALNQVNDLYRRAGTDFAPSFNWLFWLRLDGGFVDTQKIHSAIETNLNSKFADNLRGEFSKGRQIAISTTDLDLGVGRVWSLNQELTEKPSSLGNLHHLLFAATAIPGVFPIELVDGHLHADGGVTSSLLPLFDFEDYKRLASRLRELGQRNAVHIHVYVISNLFTHPAVKVIRPSDRSGLGDRGIELVYELGHPMLLTYVHLLAAAVTTNIPGLVMDEKRTSIPIELQKDPNSTQIFNQRWIETLAQSGYDRARGSSPWDDEAISPFVRPLGPE